MMHEVFLSKRLALRILNNEVCKIYVEKAHSEFTIEPGIREDNTVYVPIEKILVPISDITKVEVTNRFGGFKTMMKIDWDNDL